MQRLECLQIGGNIGSVSIGPFVGLQCAGDVCTEPIRIDSGVALRLRRWGSHHCAR